MKLTAFSKTNLATFLAMDRKYPNKQPQEILNDLIASTLSGVRVPTNGFRPL
jgi:hypothetical protein